MEPNTILGIIIGILIFDFFFEQILDFINLKHQRTDIPEEMKEYYDSDKYVKSQKYLKENTRFSFITSSFSFILALLLLITGFFGGLDIFLREYISHPIVLSLIYFGVLFIISDIITIPFQLYATFVIEEKYGFNKTTPKTFIIDKVKGYLITTILGVIILGALLYLIEFLGSNFWIYFWIVSVAFMLFMNMFYATLILPIFNKLTPLEDGELKESIVNYSKKINFPVINIFVMDGSKRSSKSNAFFSGLGKKKKIVLFDTLIKNHSIEELTAVLAHEVGHYKKKHILTSFIISILQTGLTLFILSLFVFNENLSLALGGDQLAIHLNLIAFALLYTPVSKITSLFMVIFSRKNEFEADEYATVTYNGKALKTALKKLSVDNLSNLYPHPLYVFFNYSHPPILKRLQAIDRNLE